MTEIYFTRGTYGNSETNMVLKKKSLMQNGNWSCQKLTSALT